MTEHDRATSKYISLRAHEDEVESDCSTVLGLSTCDPRQWITGKWCVWWCESASGVGGVASVRFDSNRKRFTACMTTTCS